MACTCSLQTRDLPCFATDAGGMGWTAGLVSHLDARCVPQPTQQPLASAAASRCQRRTNSSGFLGGVPADGLDGCRDDGAGVEAKVFVNSGRVS